jgi:hypothetical protein
MKNTIKYFILFAVLCFYSCGGDGEIPLDDKGREDFISFYDLFYRDSSFQMQRIEFPMLGNNPDGSTERFFWDEDNWTFQKGIDLEDKDVELVPFFDMEDVMRARIILQNRFMIENLFSLINNKWYLTEYSGVHDIGYYKKGVKQETDNHKNEIEISTESDEAETEEMSE